MFDSSAHRDWYTELDALLESSSPKAPDPDFFQHVADCVVDIPEATVVEFGVASGSTINQIAKVFPDRTVWGFDSFEGLPEDWNPTHPAGSFKQSSLPLVADNVKLVNGWFSETLNQDWEAYGEYVAFAHIDCDLFSSTMTVVDWLWTRVVPGSIILFDELYYTYDGRNYLDHEYKALLELVGRLRYRDLTLEYFGQRHTEAFAFKVVHR